MRVAYKPEFLNLFELFTKIAEPKIKLIKLLGFYSKVTILDPHF